MIYDPCSAEDSAVNTGVECAKNLKATAGIIVGNAATFRFTMAQVNAAPYNGNLTEFLRAQTHAPLGQRIFPLFGNFAPVNDITENNDSDTIETLPNGAMVFVKDRMYNRTFVTIEGGLCLAERLLRLKATGFMEIDIAGQILLGKYGKNSAGEQVYGFITTNMIKGLAPTLATFTTSFKNNLMISFSPNAYIQNSALFATAEDENVLGLKGLLDADVTQATGVATAYSGGTAATGGTTTVTAIGANGDTVSVAIGGRNVSGTIIKTSSESTATLLATKIAAAVNALTATNGGITATSAAAVVTYVIPASFGAALNTTSPVITTTGGIAATNTAFTGGVDGTITLTVDVKTECAGTDLIAAYPGTTTPGLVQSSNFIVKKNSVVVAITGTVLTAGGDIAISFVGGAGTYVVSLAAAGVLYNNGVDGYDGAGIYTVVVP